MNTKNFNPTTIFNNKNQISDFAKRSFDLIVSLVALIILAPVFALIARAIRRDSPGPAFYRGSRSGCGGKTFEILKFRTMFETPESYRGPKVTAKDDPRITPFGQWLRDTKINELPQFWNVLKGEMSLVGPRPEDPSIAETWPQEIRKEILSVRPGLTSPATVQYHNEEALLSSKNVLSQYILEIGPDKMRLDQLYVRYHSFWLDLDMLFWTALILFPRLRDYSPPEKLLFLGPITRIFKRYVNWFTVDLLVTFTAMGVTGFVRRIFGPLDVGLTNSVIMALGFALIFSLTGAVLGLNRISWSKASLQNTYDIARTWGIAAVVAVTANSYYGLLPANLVFGSSLLALGGFVFCRYPNRIISSFMCRLSRDSESSRLVLERVLIVGSGRTAEHLAWLLDHPTYATKFQVVGFVDDNLQNQGMRIYGTSIIGTIKDIPKVVEKYDIGIIALADHRIALQEYRSRIMKQCTATSARIVSIPDIYGSIRSLENSSSRDSMIGVDQEVFPDSPCLHCLTKNYTVQDGLEGEVTLDELQPPLPLFHSIQLDETTRRGGSND